MKRVYSSYREVKHLFCNQWRFVTEDDGKQRVYRTYAPTTARSGNVRYEPMNDFIPHPLRTDNLKHLDADGTSTPPSILYSFRTPIAVIFPEKKVAVITSTQFSPSTGRHMLDGRDLPGVWTVVHACLHKDDATVDRSFSQATGHISRWTEPQDWVNELLYYAERQVKETAAPRTRKAANADRIASAQRYHARAVELAAQFGCPVPPPLELDGRVLIEQWRAAAKARDAAIEAARQEERAKREADRLRDLPRNLERLAAWRAGVTRWEYGLDRALAAPDEEEKTYLRVNGNEVETSRGARIPVADAAAAWPMLRQLHNNGLLETVTREIARRANMRSQLKFGPYPFESFDGQTLVVGCHHIDYSELELIAPAVLAAVQGVPA